MDLPVCLWVYKVDPSASLGRSDEQLRLLSSSGPDRCYHCYSSLVVFYLLLVSSSRTAVYRLLLGPHTGCSMATWCLPDTVCRCKKETPDTGPVAVMMLFVSEAKPPDKQ